MNIGRWLIGAVWVASIGLAIYGSYRIWGVRPPPIPPTATIRTITEIRPETTTTTVTKIIKDTDTVYLDNVEVVRETLWVAEDSCPPHTHHRATFNLATKKALIDCWGLVSVPVVSGGGHSEIVRSGAPWVDINLSIAHRAADQIAATIPAPWRSNLLSLKPDRIGMGWRFDKKWTIEIRWQY